MDFVKKHYEKILLSLVLLGLAAAAALMPIKVSTVEQDLATVEEALSNPSKPKVFKATNTSTNEAVLASLKSAPRIVLTGTNNLVNPVKWVRKNDGSTIKLSSGHEFGPSAVVVSNTKPLYLRVAYEGIAGTPENMRYQFAVTREADKVSGKRRKTSMYATPGAKNEVFLLKEIKGPKEDPTEFVIVLLDENQTVTVVKGEEFKRVSGYTATLSYPPENLNFPPDLRKGDKIKFGGETYNIVAIEGADVTLSANSNGKNTTVSLKTAQ